VVVTLEMAATFHIFFTAGGHARYVETVENLTAKERLMAHNASGDCFRYSTQSGIVAQVPLFAPPQNLVVPISSVFQIASSWLLFQ
jgi:hypothetical protein